MNTQRSFKSSFWKIFFYSLASCIALLLLLIGIAPWALSSSWGKGILISQLEKSTRWTVSIDALSLQWFGSQRFEGVRISENDDFSSTIQRIDISSPLYKILFSPHDLKETIITSPKVKLSKRLLVSSHVTPPALQRGGFSLAFAQKKGIPKSLSSVTGHIVIKDGEAEMIGQGIDTIYVKDVNGEISLPKKGEPLKVSITGNTQQIKNPKSDVIGTDVIGSDAIGTDVIGADAIGSFSIQGDIQNPYSAAPAISLDVKIDHFPVRGLDQMTALFYPEACGLLVEALGPTLNLSLDAKSSIDSLSLVIDASCARMEAHLQTKTQNDGVCLSSPAQLTFSLTPGLVKKLSASFAPLKGIILKQAASAQIVLNKLNIPFFENKINLKELSFEAALALSPFSLEADHLPATLAITSFQGGAVSSSLKEGIQFQGDIAAAYGQVNTSLSLKGSCKDLLESMPDVQFTLSAKSLPVAFIGALAKQEKMLALALGPSLDMNVQGDWNDAASHFVLSGRSSQFELKETKIAYADGILLEAPTAIAFTSSPAFLKEAFSSEDLAVADLSPLLVSIKSFSLPPSLQFEAMTLSAEISSDKLLFSPFFDSKELSLNHLACTLDMKGARKISLDFSSDPVKFKTEAALQTDPLSITFLKPLSVDIALSNSLLAHWVKEPLIKETATLALQIDPFTLSQNVLKTIKLKGFATLQNLVLINPKGNLEIPIATLTANFQADAKKGSGSLSLHAASPEGKGSSWLLDADTAVENVKWNKNIDFSEAKASVKGNVNNLPTSLLDTLMNKKNEFSTLLGATLNLQFHGTSTPAAQDISFQAASSLMQLQGAFTMDGNSLHLSGKEPLNIKLTVTEGSYKLFDQMLHKGKSAANQYQLKEPAHLAIQISRLSLPVAPAPAKTVPATPAGGNPASNILTVEDRFPKLSADLSQAQLAANVSLDQFTLLVKNSGQEASLRDLNLQFDKSLAGNPITFSLKTAVRSQPTAKNTAPSAKEGSLLIDGKIQSLFSENGSLDLSHLSSSFNAEIQQFPAVIFDAFTNSTAAGSTAASSTKEKNDLPFSALFGSSLNATISADLQNFSGPVKFNISSSNTRASLNGAVKDGMLTLQDTFYAQVTLTKELGALIYDDISAKNPITLEIPAKGFSVLLFPFKMKEVNVPNMRLELGQILCKNQGAVNAALGVLKAKASPEQELKLWFAPVDIHIRKGIADIERTEILIADSFEMATWGTINLREEYVDMILGLTAQCLEKAFGITRLPDDYVMQIPMKGKFGKVKLDTSSATTKIALLMAWQKNVISGALGGGTKGALFGEIFGKAVTLPDLNAKAPPAKRPFPWDKDKKTSDAFDDPAELQARQYSKKKIIKKGDKPRKQILKILRP